MSLSFGVCIALEMALFVFANDSSVNSQNIAILQKLKTLEVEVSMLKQRELKTLEEVSMLKQSLKSCQSGCNESSKSNAETSEYKPCLFGYLKPKAIAWFYKKIHVFIVLSYCLFQVYWIGVF